MKKFYTSRTLWINLLAAVALFVQSQYGYVISPELQAYALVVLNSIMRLITSQGLQK